MKQKLQTKESLLSSDLKLRPAQWADVKAVAQLILDVCTHDGDPTVADTPEDIEREWKTPGVVLETDAFVVETSDGRIVGYEVFYDNFAFANMDGDGYVHPDFMGRGIGTALLRALEARARKEMELAEPDLRVFIRNAMGMNDTVAREMHEHEGYKAIRFNWRMEITLDDVPFAPNLPEGIELRPFDMEHDHAIFEAHEEAFSDHWGHVRRSYKEWMQHYEDRDRSLWLIAWDGDQIAGYSFGRIRNDIGWVGPLGVRRPWRKRGLGEALLLYSFAEFHKRGQKIIGLGVDAENPTGATRLYQKAGMHIASEYVIYEKELRPGREPAEQEEKNEMKAYLQEQIEATLPEGFTDRGATLDDIEPAVRLMNIWSQKVLGEDEITDINDLLNEMKMPGFTPEENLRGVFAPNGQMVGYIEVWTHSKPPVHPWVWGRVHPEYEGLGIGTWLMKWAEKRALRELVNIPEELRLAPRTGIQVESTGSMKLFEDLGYKKIRSSYRMKIDMNGPVPESEWPEGITIKPYNPDSDAEAVYRADTEAFRDHFGFVEQPFEEGFKNFMQMMTGYEGFDPTLWFLAMDGDEIAGISLCRPNAYDDRDLGFVNTLAVRRPWRKRGLGLALLRHSFNELYRRGKRKVGLGVDAENLTGALRLYEKAGLHVYRQYNSYEKELRAGKEISVQSLSE